MRQPEWRILWVVADVNAAVFEGYSAAEMRQPEWRILWVIADVSAAVFEGYSAAEMRQPEWRILSVSYTHLTLPTMAVV